MRHVASKLPASGDAATPAAAPLPEDNEKKEDEDAEEDTLPSSETEEQRLEQLYEQIAWPLGRKYGHPYEAFKLALTYVHSFSFLNF